MKKLSELSESELKLALEVITNEKESLEFTIGKIETEIYLRQHPEVKHEGLDTSIDVDYYLST